MGIMDQVFWWTGAVVAFSACIMVASLALYLSAVAVRKACNAWWERTLAIYRIESLRYYFRIMVKNGRAGLLKEVDQSKVEAASAEGERNE